MYPNRAGCRRHRLHLHHCLPEPAPLVPVGVTPSNTYFSSLIRSLPRSPFLDLIDPPLPQVLTRPRPSSAFLWPIAYCRDGSATKAWQKRQLTDLEPG
jgi:hypothetical protein